MVLLTLSENYAPFFSLFVRFSELLDCRHTSIPWLLEDAGTTLLARLDCVVNDAGTFDWLNTHIRSLRGNWYLRLLQVNYFPRVSKINNFMSLFP